MFKNSEELKYYYDRKFYFNKIARKCGSDFNRNEDEKTPKCYKETIDQSRTFQEKDLCNYHCRSIYMEEKGRCYFEEGEYGWGRGWRCTYLEKTC
jgi:hypothetical protein